MNTDEEDPEIGFLADGFADAVRLMRRLRKIESVLSEALNGHFDERVHAADADGEMYDYNTPVGSFDYISIQVPRFIDALIEVDAALEADPDYAVKGARYRPVRYLEVGCGPGRNIALIRHGNPVIWADLHGFDINRPLVAAGQKAFGLEKELEVADAMSFDYAPYDLIFSYRPFMDDEKQMALEEYMENSMRVGAYLISPLAMNRRSGHRMLAIGNDTDVWKKIA